MPNRIRTTGKKPRTASVQTRTQLILVAESLCAERGIEAVSLREISLGAGQANNNAVQYHFGTKDDLLHAIFEYRVAMMEEPRRLMFEKAEAAGRLRDIRTLLQIYAYPHLGLADEGGLFPHAGFMSQYLSRLRPRGMKHPVDNPGAMAEQVGRMNHLLHESLSWMPPEVVDVRIIHATLAFMNLLVQYDAARTHNRPTLPLTMLVEDTIDVMTQICLTPYRYTGQDLFKSGLAD